MSLSLTSSVSAMAPLLSTYFLAIGGVEPYTYSVLTGDGTIDSVSGQYTAPPVMNSNPKLAIETIQVVDSAGTPATATLDILVADPIYLLCDIIQKEMNLAQGRVYLFNQKIMQPTDAGLYVAVSVPSCKPFGNNISFDGGGAGLDAVQSVNVLANVAIDVISRGPDAFNRKTGVLFALGSVYSENQQVMNSFNIGKLPSVGQFVDLSGIDGDAIPYRYRISFNMQYFDRQIKAAPYYDDFADVAVTTEP